MSLTRIFQNQEFLFSKLDEAAILACSIPELEAIVELIINLKTLNILDQSGSAVQTLYNDFENEDKLSVLQIRNFIIGNLTLVKSVIEIALIRILEEWVLCGFDNASAKAFDE